MAVAEDPSGVLRFHLAEDEHGAGVRGILTAGTLDELRAEVSAVALADYGLIDHRVLKPLRDHAPMLLLPPASNRTGAPTAGQILRAVVSADDVALVPAVKRRLLEPYLDERRQALRRRAAASDRIEWHLQNVSPEYAALLLVRGRISGEVARLLVTYPTVRRLEESGPVRLRRFLLNTLEAAHRGTVDGLLELRGRAGGAPDPVALAAAEIGIPWLAKEVILLDGQVEELDRGMYRLAAGHGVVGHRSAEDGANDGRRSGGPAEPSAYAAPAVRTSEADAVVAEMLSASFRLGIDAPSSSSAYEQYQRGRRRLGVGLGALPVEVRLRLDIDGQRLALAVGDHTAAIRYQESAELLLFDHQASSALPARLRADARIMRGVVLTDAVDSVVGGEELEAALSGPDAAVASADVVVQGVGRLALLLLLAGEKRRVPALLARCEDLVRARGLNESARAPIHIARLYMSGMSLQRPRQDFYVLLGPADRSSLGTSFRFYFHYLTMVCCCVIKDAELGLEHYNELQRTSGQSCANTRVARMCALAQATLLAARGNYRAARAILAELSGWADVESDSLTALIHRFLSRRLELGVGDRGRTLSDTSARGPLWDQRLEELGMQLYVPTVLMLRGSALVQDDTLTAARHCFARATSKAVAQDDFLALLSVETPEYRTWMASLEPADYPSGFTAGLRDEILSRDMLISRTLPPLTHQQRRILGLLAAGRSSGSIAAELHISTNTIKTHLRQLYRKLGVASRDQAVLLADEYGLL